MNRKKKILDSLNEEDLILNEDYVFETFVPGDINRYAYNAALAVARDPGGSSNIYNPLLIYGGTGLGKTHLIQAIGNYNNKNSDLKIIYCTGESFMYEFVCSVGYGQKFKDAFHNKYRNVDILLIDAIHTIERGAGTQEELYYTFESLYNNKKQMVFTCDRPINELTGMAPRLLSRFQQMLNVRLDLPEREGLIEIINKIVSRINLAYKMEVILSDEIIELIIENFYTNVCEIIGAVKKLMGYAYLFGKPLTLEVAQRELKDHFVKVACR